MQVLLRGSSLPGLGTGQAVKPTPTTMQAMARVAATCVRLHRDPGDFLSAGFDVSHHGHSSTGTGLRFVGLNLALDSLGISATDDHALFRDLAVSLTDLCLCSSYSSLSFVWSPNGLHCS